MSLKIERQDLDERRVRLNVEVPEERSRAALRSAARRLSKQSRIPGFRPGKAPYEVVARQFGETAILEEALDTLGQEVYADALKQEQIEPFAPGSLEEVVSENPLTLRFTVPLPPSIELGQYRGIRIPYHDPQVSDEALEEVLEELRQSQALIEPVERPAQMTDVILLDVRGEMSNPDQEQREPLLDQKGVSLLINQEADWPFPGIAQHLIGLQADEEKDMEYVFPEDYPDESLRGRKAIFHIQVLEVKSRLVPEWTDSLARNLGEFEDLLDLRIKVRAQLQEAADRRADSEYAQQAIDLLVSGAKIDFPPILLEDEIEDMLRDLDRRLQNEKLSLEDYLKIENKSKEELRKELEPRARDRIRRALALGKVVEVEQLNVEEGELQTEIDRMVEPFGDQAHELRKAFDNPESHRRVGNDLLTQKAIQRLVAIAKGEVDRQTQDSQDPSSETAKPFAKSPVFHSDEDSENENPQEGEVR